MKPTPRHVATHPPKKRPRTSKVTLSGAQTRIQDWWAQAYDAVLGERFRLEAQASLPLVGGGAGVEQQSSYLHVLKKQHRECLFPI